jgi:hypothetical protein
VRITFARTLITTAAAVALAVPFLPSALGQFPAESTIPKAKRGKARRIPKGPEGPTPRMKDGKINLGGVWGYAGYTSDIAKDYELGEVPMTSEALKLFTERQANLGKDDPEARCLPTGVPRRDPYPMKFIHTDDLLVILYEGNIHSFRQLYLDGRKHPEGKAFDPTWYGHSTGTWEGNDKLVVDTAGFVDKLWLDMAGHPATGKLHVIERYTRPNYGTLVWNFTIDDPGMYTKPWDVTEVMPLMDKEDIMEYICTENNLDVDHLVGNK